MADDLKPGDTLTCERCEARYRVVEQGSIDTPNEARCTYCGTIMTGWPKLYGLKPIKPPLSDVVP